MDKVRYGLRYLTGRSMHMKNRDLSLSDLEAIVQTGITDPGEAVARLKEIHSDGD